MTGVRLNYTVLNLHIPEKVIITPLDPPRIHHFVNSYITDPPGAGDVLFWELAGKMAYKAWQHFSKEVGELLEIFWMAEVLPSGKQWGWGIKGYENRDWDDWLKTCQQPRSMLQLTFGYFFQIQPHLLHRKGLEMPPSVKNLSTIRANNYLLVIIFTRWNRP